MLSELLELYTEAITRAQVCRELENDKDSDIWSVVANKLADAIMEVNNLHTR